MGLKEKILDDMKQALKKQEADRLGAIRFLQAAVKNREIELRPGVINDLEIMNVVKKMVKQHKDSIEAFEKAGRKDLADKEKFELTILEEYLPKQLSQEDLTKVVDEVIAALTATSVKQMGAVIKEVQARTQGAADGRMISELVKARLQG